MVDGRAVVGYTRFVAFAVACGSDIRNTEMAIADIVMRLAEQEEAVAALYAAFSEALPGMRNFWRNLVAEEKAQYLNR